MAAVLASVTGVALGSVIEGVKDCDRHVTLHMSAAADIAPVLGKHAKQWSHTADPVDGACVTVDVTAQDSASVAMALARKYSAAFDIGKAKTTDVRVPDVWVPESMTWLARLGGDLGGHLNPHVGSVAESVLGLAVTKKTDGAGESTMLQNAKVDPSDPRADAGALALLLESNENKTAQVKYKPGSATVMSKAAYDLYMAKHPGSKLEFVNTNPSLPPFEYPFITQAKMDKTLDDAGDAFLSSMLSDEFTNSLGKYGFTKAGPYPQKVDPKAVSKVLDAWDASSPPTS
jgi:hypothetical protein